MESAGSSLLSGAIDQPLHEFNSAEGSSIACILIQEELLLLEYAFCLVALSTKGLKSSLLESRALYS